MHETLHRITVTKVAPDLANSVCEALELSPFDVEATSIALAPDGRGRATVFAYAPAAPEPSDVHASIKRVLGDGADELDIAVEQMEERDWVALTQAGLAPIVAGRFLVHGSHDRHRRPPGACAIEVEAGQAFGTGHHETTRGCLTALDRLLGVSRPRRVLDLGTGSGILAIASARTAQARVVAGDVDPLAVEVARQNAVLNGVQALVRFCTATGTRHALLRASAPYDLVFANILARPLIALAPEICSVLAIGGRAILSGLTVDQEARVLSAYTGRGLAVHSRLRLGIWSVLTVGRSR